MLIVLSNDLWRDNKGMGTFNLGCGTLAPKLDLLDNVIDKMGQRTEESLIVFYMETGMLALNECFSDES